MTDDFREQPLKQAYLYVHVAVAVCGRAIISICTLTISYFTLDLLVVQKSTPFFIYVLSNLNMMAEQGNLRNIPMGI